MEYLVQFEYTCREVRLAKGQRVTLSADEAAWLNRDAPGVVKPVIKQQPDEQPTGGAKAQRRPTSDKAVHTAEDK